MHYKLKTRKKFFFIIPVLLLFAITALVMWLWNLILPSVLNVNTITYWQAMGILVLSKILFGGFHGCKKGRHGMYKNHLIHKMKHMNPEEREAFKAKWKERFKNHGSCND